MAKLNLDKEDSEVLNKAIIYWETEGFIDTETAEKLSSSYELKKFDWKSLAKNSFTIALIFGIIAIASFIINDKIINWLKKLYDTPDIIIGFISAILALTFFYEGNKRKQKYSERLFSNEAILCSGVLFTGTSLVYIGKAVDSGSNHFSLLILVAVIIYVLLAIKIRSDLIWISALVSLGLWFGTETGFQTNWSPYFLRMNYPLRFVFFGWTLIYASFAMLKSQRINLFRDITYVSGLLCLFISLWLLSIFGNFGSIEDWSVAKQSEMLPWALISTFVSLGAILYGFIRKDVIALEFGIIFLFVNLYSRYFEYLWGVINRPVFFSILAISFWLIGRKAEKIWNLEIFKK